MAGARNKHLRRRGTGEKQNNHAHVNISSWDEAVLLNIKILGGTVDMASYRASKAANA